ncbi:MAG TPA: formate dehydrogenase accessory sulfurtransferase FdhD [bacterium]|nr:formate dehydrogenase accessory sulfurtransferase FdhD [bacterium]
MKPSSPVRILRLGPNGKGKTAPDQVASEEPLEIRVNGKSIAVVMRTPGHDRELAAGFLYTEGLIRSPKDIKEIVACKSPKSDLDENIVNVFVGKGAGLKTGKHTRHFYTSSSCGICGKASIESVFLNFKPNKSKFKIPTKILLGLPQTLRAVQDTFEKTGGLHASALFDSKGNLVVSREDVGRHNALDKVVGWGFLGKRLPFKDYGLLVSGRVSFEIMQKALAAGIPLVAAIGAPSSLAVSFAKGSGQILVGFLKNTGMNVYVN